MATLRTQGFQVGATERAPQIPANIGKVDVRGIYDAVRSGLANFEAARQAPASMLLADVEAKEKTAQAPMQTAILAERVPQERARTQAILAESTPEALQAKRDLAAMRSMKAPPPAVQVAQALAAAEESLAANPNDIRAKTLVDSLRLTQNKMGALSPVDPTAERLSREGVALEGLESKERLSAEQIAARAAEAEKDRALKRQMQTDELASRERVVAAQEQNRVALANAKTDQQRAAVGSKALSALEAGKDRLKLFNRTVGRAVENLTGSETGTPSESKIPGWDIGRAIARVIGTYVPGSQAANLEGLVDTLKSEAGFKELEQMRLSAPGGQGASGLGQVTERELAFLQNRVANLKLAQSDKQLYDNILELQDAVNTAWKHVEDAYKRTYGTAMPGRGGVTAAVPTRTAATAGPDEATTDMPQTPDQQFEIGKTYRDAAGNRAIFRGNGQWEEIR